MAKLRRSTTYGSWWNWEVVTRVKVREPSIEWRKVKRYKEDPRLRRKNSTSPSEP